MPKASERVGKRYPLNIRTTKEIRDWLEEAASRNGRSLTAELESLVERSFEWQRAFKDVDTMRAETMAKLEEIEVGSAKAALHRLGWQKLHGTRYGTVWLPPGRV